MDPDTKRSKWRQPDAIPPEWLKVRLLPTVLISPEELLARYQTWVAIEKAIKAIQLENEPSRDDDGNLLIYFDPETGRTRIPVPLSERDVANLFASW